MADTTTRFVQTWMKAGLPTDQMQEILKYIGDLEKEVRSLQEKLTNETEFKNSYRKSLNDTLERVNI